MGRKKLGKNRLDKYYHMAKEHGFRSRSAYKLFQLNEKFHFLENCTTLLDLCAAPGGWMQVAEKEIKSPRNSQPMILGVDLHPIRSLPISKSIVGDITTESCYRDIKQFFGNNKIDVILHDGAPNVGSNWEKDAYVQNDLALNALKLATKLLIPGGVFLTKVFRSKDYLSLLYVFNQLFDKVESTKPLSSRSESAEIFIFCGGFKKLDKIDESFFDSNKILNSDTIDENEKTYKKLTFDELLFSANPIQLIKNNSSITFTEEHKIYFDVFDEETRILLKDCQAICDTDIKKILRKRDKVIKRIDTQTKVEDKKVVVSTENKLKKIENILKKKERDEKKEKEYKMLRMARSKIFEEDSAETEDEENINDVEEEIEFKEENNSELEESDSESFDISSDDKKCLAELKEDPVSFKENTVGRYTLSKEDYKNLPDFYKEEEKENKKKSTLFNDECNPELFKKVPKKQIEVMGRKMKRALKFNTQMENEDKVVERPLRIGMKKQKKQKKLVVQRKGKNLQKQNGRIKVVDKRMKKDIRKRKR
ncbi:FtsJ, 23S rRNA methylase [Spraguea lophii 42_110]|uniref:FtsJ, 23S rRNA methylase n=1 Tax=Spraguea lophii (strain 42_110) TaxID=1358809 RepID=S7XVN4_SPRLO|nr:FtsJ, 23S rRNA methylase [Spraguea lophii 42_110]